MSDLLDYVRYGNEIERLRELIARGIPVDCRDSAGRTPLFCAVMRCNLNDQDSVVLPFSRELINSGANVDIPELEGKTPLALAVFLRHYKMIEILLQAKADVNKQDMFGWSALHYAVNGFNATDVDQRTFKSLEVRVLKLLLNYNPYINIRTMKGQTPLMLSTQTGNANLVRILLRRGASVDKLDSRRDTAMYYALCEPEVDIYIVLELAIHGGSFGTVNEEHKSPPQYYLRNLTSHHSVTNVMKAKNLIKLFILDGYAFNAVELWCIRYVDGANAAYKLNHFIEMCNRDIRFMKFDFLALNLFCYNIALKGAFRKRFEPWNHVTIEVYRRVLRKLMKSHYDAYADVIAAGICRSFLNIEFDTICGENIRRRFKFNQLDFVTPYLSHFDMVNAMIAFSNGNTRDRRIYAYFMSCSIS